MFKIKLLFVILLLLLNSVLYPQKRIDFTSIDNLMSQIPDSLTRSTSGIAGFINSNLNNQKDKAYAIFTWITNNVQYDVDNMFNIEFYQNSINNVAEVLNSRIGICMHFADLFKEIATKVGIKSYVILGYTKQHGIIDYIPHSWCAGLVDSSWYLFDPVWGSGFIQNGKFVKRRNLTYYMTKPKNFIKSHMPFDPLWQFINYPITNQEFLNGETSINKSKAYFNFADTLQKHENQSEIDQIASSIKRIKQNGIKNVLTFREIEYLSNKILTVNYNKAVNLYNQGINQFNKSISIWNQFKPEKNINTMIRLIDSAEFSLNSSRAKLKEIKNPTGFYNTSINQLNMSINIAIENLIEQKAALDRYQKSRRH